MRFCCAILDDYQNVALSMADWPSLSPQVDFSVFNEPFGSEEAAARMLADYDIVCLMRERTPFPRPLFERLPKLQLLMTSGMRNAAIDLQAAKERNVIVSGTDLLPHPTAELTIGLLMSLARNIAVEHARLRAGEAWQGTIGTGLSGKTLGIVGLGKLGSRVAKLAQALDMQVIAWSPNLTPEKTAALGVRYVEKAALFRTADFVAIHMVLAQSTRGLVGAAELALMKPTAFLINTARGPLVKEDALISVLESRRIAGAALDVFDVEPLPRDHRFRQLPNLLITPHLGYVTQENYRLAYSQMVEAIRAFLDGKPIRTLTG